MTRRLRNLYEASAQRGEIERDEAQLVLLAALDGLIERLGEGALARKSSALGWLFGQYQRPDPIRGLYIHGAVGRGKTMLMDWFFDAVPVAAKRRAHFHEFMLDVHERIHEWREKHRNGEVRGDDPIAAVADALAQEARLLCFDEFHVTDITDAMILGRLFTRLFEAGVVLVATSNVAPDDLYKDGLNRALFVPFLALLKSHVEVMALEARTDFRLEKLEHVNVWHVPASGAALDKVWRDLTGVERGEVVDLPVKGRVVQVEAHQGVARMSFPALCAQPLGAADYLRIGHKFHTLIVDAIPVMGMDQRNEAKRFITLIDTLYDLGVKLIASADAEPIGLYVAESGNESFEFSRTVSRLMEMRSREYLGLAHGRGQGLSGVATGLVET